MRYEKPSLGIYLNENGKVYSEHKQVIAMLKWIVNKSEEVKKKRYKKCDRCGHKGPEVTKGPCPYASEINNDYSDRVMCENCRYEASQDI